MISTVISDMGQHKYLLNVLKIIEKKKHKIFDSRYIVYKQSNCEEKCRYIFEY